MKTIFVLMISLLFFSTVTGQNNKLRITFLKTENEYLKTLADGKKECSFIIEGIKSDKQAKALENYIRGYRGIEIFSLTKEIDGKYKAWGVFYSFADAQYFKNLFKLIEVDKVRINNEWINIENFKTL